MKTNFEIKDTDKYCVTWKPYMAKERNVKGFKSDDEAREFKLKLLQAGDLLRVSFTITPWVGRL